jgi:hypothetical protein
MGTLDDWESLVKKTNNLKKYCVNKGSFNSSNPQLTFTDYIDELLPILEKFVDTYNGNPDVEWWNRIMDDAGIGNSGGYTYISGWILKIFGFNDKYTKGSDFQNSTFDVPVTLINEKTRIKKNLNIVGGFGGVHKTDDGAYRPQSSLIIIWDGVEECV